MSDKSKHTPTKAKAGQKMWGGRFSAEPGALMQAINVSIDFDRKLADQDIAGSKAHSDMLAAQDIITADDRSAIHAGLDEIALEIKDGSFPWSRELEDIHLNIEARLRDKIGDAAGRLHTGRSRNDQVATDFRLWVRDYLDQFDVQLGDLMKALLAQADANTDTIMPGFTHLQSAQPVTFGHHMLAYSDTFTTGSSIMPQKRNPDAAELTRAKVGRIMGALTTLMIVMKGLPLAYSKDMQEDKEPVFDAFEALDVALAAMAGMVKDMSPNKPVLAAAAGAAFSTATDLADWCVRKLDMPFRDAHHVTGTIVAMAEKQGKTLDALALSDMQSVEPRITDDVYSVLSPLASASSRVSYGGTAPSEVAKQVALWKDRLA